MGSIDSFIQNGRKLTDIFGRWPSFHDAEVVEFHLGCSGKDLDDSLDALPVLTVKIRVWEMTNEVDARGFYVCRHHTLVTLRFHGVDELAMEGFNHQNVLFDLLIEPHEHCDGSSADFMVEFNPSFGMSASFKCSGVEVLDAQPYAAAPGRSSNSR